MANVAELEAKTLSDLGEMARKLDITCYSGLKKQDLIFKLLQAHSEEQGTQFTHGNLSRATDGSSSCRCS